jgi:hypothetical protein
MTGNFQPAKNLRAWGALTVGDAVDYANSRPAQRIWGGPGFEYTFGRHLSLFIDHTYEQLMVDGERLYLANLINTNVAYQFNARCFARAVVQYTDISRNTELYEREVDASERDLFTQLLFAYKVNPQTLLYLGYTDNRYGEEVKELEQTDRTLFFKVGYAWVK